jgi:hypothetical protein
VWDFELWRKLNRFADLDDATCHEVVQEPLEMDDEYR